MQGQHEPLISEALFYNVQDVLNGRKKAQRTKLAVDDMLPSRGFLVAECLQEALLSDLMI